MKKVLIILIVIITTFLSSTTFGQTTRYVKPTASGLGDGSSWANASADLQAMINASAANDEVWVATGTYYPTKAPDGTNNSRYNTFYITSDMKIYGGFAGTETQLAQRDWTTNLTTLSGDIGVLNDSTDNCYNVMRTAGLTSATVIDGFIITEGNANTTGSSNADQSRGSGIYNASSSPTILNTTFSNNRASGDGGAIYNSSSSPTIINCKFINNSAIYFGGAIYSGSSSPNISNCLFDNNSAEEGGAIYNEDYCTSAIDNTIFSNNTAEYGGAIYNQWYCTPTMTNLLFSNNTVTGEGGGIYNGHSSPVIVNSTFYKNNASSGGAISNAVSSPTITNSIFWSNTANGGNTNIVGADIFNGGINSTPTVTYCLTQGNSTYSSGTGIINNQNPLFINSSQGDFRLQANAPGVNAGNDGAISLTTDLAGNPRKTGTVDLGAYEFICSYPSGIVYVNKNATGNNDGTSWANAFTDFQSAISERCDTTQIWVAAGTYYPTKAPDGTNNSRYNTFYITSDMKIYGGFAGTETQLAQRDWTTNLTTLSGDIGVLNDSTDNCYNVMRTAGLTSATVIDGFIITEGNANTTGSSNADQSRGSGIYNASSSPTILNTTFSNNRASGDGGAIYNSSSSPTIINCKFINNSAIYFGGAIYSGSSSPNISNCLFDNNSAEEGGAIYNEDYCTSAIDNTIFSNNTAEYGGAIYNQWYCTPTMTNLLFSNNTVTGEGGGIYNGHSSPVIVNSTFYKNNASSGGAISNAVSSPTITNSIFWSNTGNGGNTNIVGADIFNADVASTPTVTYCLTQGNSTYSSGTGIINNQNPLFTDISTGNYSLQAGSPAIDMGDGIDGASLNTTPLDLANNVRFTGTIDMGAYENTGAALPVELLYFYAEKEGKNVRLDWQTASELNNSHFDVEWSKDGISFEKISEVAGAGTTNEVQFYDFLHTSPVIGLNYYQLKQHDFDGQFEYSDIISIEFVSKSDFTFNIFPNPASHYLKIESEHLIGEIVQVFNVNGQLVKEFQHQEFITNLPITELPSGTYFIKIEQQVKKIIVQK